MSAGLLTFLLFVGAVVLQLWRPEGTSMAWVRALVGGALAFLSGIALLFSLFTVWWPPTMGWAVMWSGASVGLMAFNALSSAARFEEP